MAVVAAGSVVVVAGSVVAVADVRTAAVVADVPSVAVAAVAVAAVGVGGRLECDACACSQ